MTNYVVLVLLCTVTLTLTSLKTFLQLIARGRGSRVVKVSDRGWFVPSSSPVPLKTRRVGQRCTLIPSRVHTSSRWCGVAVRRGGASSGVILVTGLWFKMTRSVAKSPRVAER
ncbi:uncharacterized protein TNCV_3939551 [Trichonephila clavipes]|uniref:Uncharacterized protein n=1 Tax=Trichonephila clavipes TaxID=2585209 RepID=A0A8X6VVL8_TRICX|nr:uncharacterized protein TNCV_3939551 [Trichonephila clavipes]